MNENISRVEIYNLFFSHNNWSYPKIFLNFARALTAHKQRKRFSIAYRGLPGVSEHNLGFFPDRRCPCKTGTLFSVNSDVTAE